MHETTINIQITDFEYGYFIHTTKKLSLALINVFKMLLYVV